MKIKSVSLFTSVFLGVIASIVGQQINGFFFYNVFLGSIVAITAMIILLWRFAPATTTSRQLNTCLAIIAGLFTFSFLSTIPLTIDRSYSVWLLKTVAQAEDRGNKLTESDLIEKSVDFFSEENGQLKRRILEQQKIGNIKAGSKIQLTNKGKLITEINGIVGKIFRLDPKYSQK